MARPQVMPMAPPPEPYTTSYNAFASATSAPMPPPRLSSHPFLVDQTPYLSRRHSDMSFVSTSSGRTARSASESSTSSMASTSSSVSSTASIAPSWPAPNSGRGLAPAAVIHSTSSSSSSTRYPRHTHRTTASLSSTHSSPPQSPSAPIDRRCLQWLREAEQQEMILGSVASRVSPRGQRRELPEHTSSLEVLEEHERPPSVASTASKSRISIRRRLRLP